MLLVQEAWSSNMAEFGNNPKGRGPRNDRGPRVEEEKQFDERVVNIDRVARVVKGGRRFSVSALAVVGEAGGAVPDAEQHQQHALEGQQQREASEQRHARQPIRRTLG